MEWLYELVNISVNKNTIYGDRSAFTPGGVRIGLPALTSRDFKEGNMKEVAEFLHRGVKIATECIEKVIFSHFSLILRSFCSFLLTLHNSDKAGI